MKSLGFVAAVLAASQLGCAQQTGGEATGGSSGSNGSGGSSGSGGNGSGGNGSGGNGSGSGGNASSTGGTSTGGSGSGSGGAGTGGRSGSGGAASGGSVGSGGSATGGAGPGAGGAGRGGAPAGRGGAGVSTGGSTGAGGGPVAVSGPENTGADCKATAGDMKKNMKLPDPFMNHDGTRITTKAQWECRRNEIKKDIEKYEIGPKQEPPTVKATFASNKLSVVVTTSAGSLTISSTVSGSGSCVDIGINSSLVTGCTRVVFAHDQVVKNEQNSSTQHQDDPFYKVYPDLWKKIGNYSAWSWGISRLIDGLDQVKDEMKIDMTKIAVEGCSYAGKMALFAGAFDERIALTLAEESGGGGITSWRTSEEFFARSKVKVEKIDNTNYSWFLPSMQSLDPYSLPHDHHELIAMVAPRAFVTFGNQDYEWLGDESGYKSVNVAMEVWKAMGVPEGIGYDFTSNHNHCAAPMSQKDTATAFVNRYLKGQTANTKIYIKPQEGNFDLDFMKEMDWTTPTLQ